MIVHPTGTNSSQRRLAEAIIADMLNLLRKRHSWRIKRMTFLIAWGKLRRELATTPEYQQFRAEVLRRDGYRCGTCGRVAHTVHHRRPVARAPRLALDPGNGTVRCDECHEEIHPHLKRRKLA